MSLLRRILISLLLSLIISWGLLTVFNTTYEKSLTAEASELASGYETRALHSRDGIGKFYLGREIAKVMGHQEMLWLERPSREPEESPSLFFEHLSLAPDAVIADIGAGTGYFSFRLATQVPQGKVLAVDIQPEMLDAIAFLKTENEVSNIETILGTVSEPNLPPNTVDLAIMVDAYHEFEFPKEMLVGIFDGLKPGGKVMLLEYRKENPLIQIKALHKMSVAQTKKELQAAGFEWLTTEEYLPQQHVMTFAKPEMSRAELET
ncbi:MAG: methyltransferase domain-containing protein [Cyanobacteria bacterium P01_H01_bin.15]